MEGTSQGDDPAPAGYSGVRSWEEQASLLNPLLGVDESAPAGSPSAACLQDSAVCVQPILLDMGAQGHWRPGSATVAGASGTLVPPTPHRPGRSRSWQRTKGNIPVLSIPRLRLRLNRICSAAGPIPGVHFKFSHTNVDDACEAIVTENLRFDLSAVIADQTVDLVVAYQNNLNINLILRAYFDIS